MNENFPRFLLKMKTFLKIKSTTFAENMFVLVFGTKAQN